MMQEGKVWQQEKSSNVRESFQSMSVMVCYIQESQGGFLPDCLGTLKGIVDLKN